MTIERFLNHGIPYLRLMASQGLKKNGDRIVQRRKLVLSLGPQSRHDDGKPDYLKRLRESYKAGKPLIKELEPYVEAQLKNRITITFEQGEPACIGDPKRMAGVILDPVFRALGLDELFASIKCASKIRYDLTGIVRLLVYGRLLEPASKSATMDQNRKYYKPPVSSSNDDNVYDALDVIQCNANQIFRRMNTCIKRGAGRNSKVVFYDVTNFFFETNHPDPDFLDDDGNVLEKGLRKLGVSKENRKQPIVQLGLFLDDNGIPISFGTFPGNMLDHHTFKPAMAGTVDALDLDRFVLVADRGMHSSTNMAHIVEAGNGYIVAKSLRKSKKEEIAWALSPDGYDMANPNFRCKSRIVTKVLTSASKDPKEGEKPEKRKVKEKVVVYWSKSFYEREIRENKSFLAFIEKLKANPNGFRITAAQSQNLRKFLKKDVYDKNSGEILDGSKLVAMIDETKLSQFNNLFGYYQIVTSEVDMPDREVIEKYHGLTQIEDQFREMKSTLETRPVYVRTKEHIQAHLMVCFIALTMLRLIQRKTKECLPKEWGKDLSWTYGLPGERVAKALADWKVDELPDEYFRMLNTSGEDLATLLRAFRIQVSPKLYTRGDIRAMKSSVSVF